MPKLSAEDWMPVFAVPYGGRVISAPHPTEGKGAGDPVLAELRKSFEKSWQRIGTASRCEDGGWILELTQIPETLELVIRPARDGEQQYCEVLNSTDPPSFR